MWEVGIWVPATACLDEGAGGRGLLLPLFSQPSLTPPSLGCAHLYPELGGQHIASSTAAMLACLPWAVLLLLYHRSGPASVSHVPEVVEMSDPLSTLSFLSVALGLNI